MLRTTSIPIVALSIGEAGAQRHGRPTRTSLRSVTISGGQRCGPEAERMIACIERIELLWNPSVKCQRRIAARCSV